MIFTGLVCLKKILIETDQFERVYIYCLSTKYGHIPVWGASGMECSVVPLAVRIYAGKMQMDSNLSSFITGLSEGSGQGEGMGQAGQKQELLHTVTSHSAQ